MVGTGVAVGLGVAVGRGVAVGVGTGVAVGLGVAVGRGVAVGVGASVAVAVGRASVAVGAGVSAVVAVASGWAAQAMALNESNDTRMAAAKILDTQNPLAGVRTGPPPQRSCPKYEPSRGQKCPSPYARQVHTQAKKVPRSLWHPRLSPNPAKKSNPACNKKGGQALKPAPKHSPQSPPSPPATPVPRLGCTPDPFPPCTPVAGGSGCCRGTVLRIGGSSLGFGLGRRSR